MLELSNMERRVPFAVNEHYHVYNRGAHRSLVFLDTADFERFMLLLYLANDSSSLNFSTLAVKYKGRSFADMFSAESRQKDLVDVLAFSLMPNHFHLVLREKKEFGIVTYMRKLATAYSMYFNLKHDHTGVLFQGRFKSQHIDNEPYFRWIFSYVHLNPLGIAFPDWEASGVSDSRPARDFMAAYQFSSYVDYAKKYRPEKIILTDKDVPTFLEQQNDLEELLATYQKDRPFTLGISS